MEFERQLKYYYLRLIRLKDDPRELALGMALGIFCGMLPVVPFQTVFAITLALFFKASKVTAAVGTWISNPLNWYFIYYCNYKLGSFILGLSEKNATISAIFTAIKSGQEPMVIVGKMLGSGAVIIIAFIIGGLVIGTFVAVPSYFGFVFVFRYIHAWRESIRKN